MQLLFNKKMKSFYTHKVGKYGAICQAGKLLTAQHILK